MKVVFFDGICIMCNGFVNFISKHDKLNNILFCDIRSEEAQKILLKNSFKVESIKTIVFLNDEKIFVKSEAIIQIIYSLGGFFKIVFLFKLFPEKLRDYIYDQFAKKRFLFGEKKYCELNQNLSKKIIC